MRLFFYWAWAFWLIYFGVLEGIAVYHEVVNHKSDEWTFTHFIAVQVPIGLRIALIAWLFYHFVIVHKTM